MTPAERELADTIIARQIDLFRFEAGERRRILAILKRMEDDLIDVLLHAKLTETSRRDKAALLKQAQDVIESYYGEASDEIGRNLAGMGKVEAQATAAGIGAAFQGAISPQLPTEQFFRSMIGETLIQGAPSASWWERQAGDVAFRFANEIRQGLAQAETNDQIIRRIRGGRGVPGVMGIARNNAAALVQTSVQTISNAARYETFQRNDDIIKGLEQLSTFDSHTTPICVAYSGAQWTLDKKPIAPTTLPFNNPGGAPTGTPRHWGCRSLLRPILKTYRELGLDIDEPARTTRAAAGGPIKADTSFKEFIDRKGRAFTDDLLGLGKAELYREGKITLQQLVDQTGRQLTLEQLQAKYGGG